MRPCGWSGVSEERGESRRGPGRLCGALWASEGIWVLPTTSPGSGRLGGLWAEKKPDSGAQWRPLVADQSQGNSWYKVAMMRLDLGEEGEKCAGLG